MTGVQTCALPIYDQQVNTYADLSKILDSKEIGEVVSVTLLRNDKELNYNVTLQASSNS